MVDVKGSSIHGGPQWLGSKIAMSGQNIYEYFLNDQCRGSDVNGKLPGVKNTWWGPFYYFFPAECEANINLAYSSLC